MSAYDPKRTSGACHTHAILPDCRSFGSLCDRQAAGDGAQAVIRSVELIVQPDAKDGVGEMRVCGPPAGT
jgi:hypothetical protein